MILFSHLKPQFYVQLVYRATIPFTAKRILERLGLVTSSLFVKIWMVCIPEFKANFLFVCLFFLSRIYWSALDHDLMASIWEKVISILAGNLNSSRSYPITALYLRTRLWKTKHSKAEHYSKIEVISIPPRMKFMLSVKI